MEDQRSLSIWWENEVRSGRDPSKGFECPLGKGKDIPSKQFRADLFHADTQKTISDIIFDSAVQYLQIDSEEKKLNLKLFFDFYSEVNIKERITKSFLNQENKKL